MTTIMTTSEYPSGLTAKENNELIKEYQLTHSEEIKQKLILGNMRLASYYIKEHGEPFIDCVCLGYPTYEDLNQIAIFEILECIEKFDTTRGITFSSYFTRALYNRFLEESRTKKNSKNELHYDDAMASAEENLTYLDTVEDKSITPDFFTNKAEVNYYKNNIFPYLSFSEQIVVWQYYFQNKKQREIAQDLNVNRSYVTRVLKIANEKAKRFYNFGVDEVSKKLRGVVLPIGRQRKFKDCCDFIAEHGENFLRDVYLPSLSYNDKLIFQNSVLYYAGQSYEQMAKDADLPITNMKLNLKSVKSKLPHMDNTLQPNSKQSKINQVKNIVLKYGGAPFLTKYFLPTLPDNNRKAFLYGILQFTGQITGETASFAKQTLPQFKENLALSLKQLKATNFKEIVMRDIRGEQE